LRETYRIFKETTKSMAVYEANEIVQRSPYFIA
jgi:hypothetical protein